MDQTIICIHNFGFMHVDCTYNIGIMQLINETYIRFDNMLIENIV